jgi:galactokinase
MSPGTSAARGLPEAFARELGGPPAGLLRAPGRVNLIGEHIDYSGFGVLPMAIDREMAAAWRPRDDGRVLLRSAGGHPLREFTLGPEIPAWPRGDWGNYAKAAAAGLIGAQGGTWPGVEMLVASSLPASAGLSSSSALVVLSALALLAAAGRTMDPLALATLLAEAERYVGTQGGGMDQAASLLGRRGHALRIDFRPLRVAPIPFFAGHVVVVADSRVRASKAESAGYNTRAAECRLAAALISRGLGRQADPGRPGPLLADLAAVAPVDELLRLLPAAAVSRAEVTAMLALAPEQAAVLPDPPGGLELLRRARHVLTEARRVGDACTALRAGDATAFGRLMDASHESCRDDFAVSCDALERVVSLARRAGALGARLTGAGFGGCTVSLVQRDRADALCSALAETFYAGIDPAALSACLFVVEPAEGAGAST